MVLSELDFFLADSLLFKLGNIISGLMFVFLDDKQVAWNMMIDPFLIVIFKNICN